MARAIRIEWDEAIGLFADHLAYERVRPHTLSTRVRHIRNFSRAVRVGPNEVRAQHLVKYLGNPRWKPITQNGIQSSLQSFFRWAANVEHIIDKDPSMRLKRATVQAARKPAVTRRVVIDAMNDAEDERVRLMIQLIATLGLKVVELSTLHTDNITQDRHGGYVVSVNEGGIQSRTVAIGSQQARELLRDHKGWVFPGRVNGHMEAATMSKYVSKALPHGITAEHVRDVLTTEGGGRYNSPRSARLSREPDLVNNAEIQQQLFRIERDMSTDPGSAVAQSKSLLESVFKIVLDDRRVAYSTADDLVKLFRKVSDALDLSNVPGDAKATDAVRTMTRSLTPLVQGTAEMRNTMGIDHGSTQPSSAEQRHARLAFNAAVTVAEFVMDTLHAQRS